ncbi:MAG: hypothetical protein JO158_01970 [Gammaproteobacteria bacterium]|nr:hypothetical protein [Gammaproteobacteria bacterium]
MAHTLTLADSRNIALILAAAAILAGCGSHSSGGAPAGSAARSVAKKSANPSDQLSHNMVSAVASSKPSTAPVQVKFELRNRPDVGQPVDLDLAIVPMSGSVDRVSGKVEGEDGLELIEGADIPPSERPTEGVPIRHAVKVLPKHEGIFTVRAALKVDSAGVSATESYTIPLIAGTASAESPGSPAPASAAPSRTGAARPAAPATAAAQ